MQARHGSLSSFDPTTASGEDDEDEDEEGGDDDDDEDDDDDDDEYDDDDDPSVASHDPKPTSARAGAAGRKAPHGSHGSSAESSISAFYQPAEPAHKTRSSALDLARFEQGGASDPRAAGGQSASKSADIIAKAMADAGPAPANVASARVASSLPKYQQLHPPGTAAALLEQVAPSTDHDGELPIRGPAATAGAHAASLHPVVGADEYTEYVLPLALCHVSDLPCQ